MRVSRWMRRAVRRPRRLATIAALAVLGGASGALPAAAGAQPVDPLDANTPYLAWRGEQIKLAACASVAETQSLQARSIPIASLQITDFIVEDWSGVDPARAKPQIEPSTQRFYVDDQGRYCVAADVMSPIAGIAPVRLVVSFLGEPVFKHQFLAIWMNLDDPLLTRLPSGSDDAAALSVPSGDIDAGGYPVRLRVEASGNVPLLGNWGELGLGDSITLPDDFAALATRLARSDDPLLDRNPLLWDTHDDTLRTRGHPYGPCGPGDPVTIDAGDDCVGGDDLGPFSAFDALTSTAFLSSTYAIGPFDPTRADDTFLPDGKIDAGDAPMPALRVDVTIAPNSGRATDTSGIGTLESVDKTLAYSRSGDGTTQPHDLYAPFYRAFIPATAAGTSSSGIDGPSNGSNFPGFLNGNPYDFWDIAFVLREAIGTRTDCLLRGYDYRYTPRGPQSVVVYTDEHGEAQIAFRPGVDAFYDALVPNPDRNGGCDLEGINPLGTAVITATGRYPYAPVTDPDHASAPLTLAVRSLFSKTLYYEPKGTTAATENVRILTAHAQDVDGSPFVYETVCFSHDIHAETIITFGHFRPVPDPNGGGRLCTRTDHYGNAVVEVLSSGDEAANVIAHFVDERLFRAIDVQFGDPGSSGGTPPPVPSVPNDNGGNGGPPPAPTAPGSPPAAPTVAQFTAAGVPAAAIAQATGRPAPTAGAARAKARVATASLVRSASGRRWLVLRVNAARSTVRVKIRLVGRGGRTLTTLTRTIRANRRVTLRLGALANGARSVRVTLG